MRKQLFLLLLAVLASACATHRHPSLTWSKHRGESILILQWDEGHGRDLVLVPGEGVPYVNVKLNGHDNDSYYVTWLRQESERPTKGFLTLEEDSDEAFILENGDLGERKLRFGRDLWLRLSKDGSAEFIDRKKQK